MAQRVVNTTTTCSKTINYFLIYILTTRIKYTNCYIGHTGFNRIEDYAETALVDSVNDLILIRKQLVKTRLLCNCLPSLSVIFTGEEDGVVSVTGKSGGLRETVKLWSPSSASSSSMVILMQSVSPFTLPASKKTVNCVGSVTLKSTPSTVDKIVMGVNSLSHCTHFNQTS